MKLQYEIVRTKEQLSSLIGTLLSVPRFVFDLETNSLETHSETIKIVGVGFTWKPGQGIYVPFNAELSPEYLLGELEPVFSSDVLKIGQNLKYDVRVLHHFGTKVNAISFDTLIAHYCLYSDQLKHGLDDICLHHLNFVKVRTGTLIPRKSKTNKNPSMADSPIEKVAAYCCEDTDFTYRMYEELKRLLEEPGNEHAKKLFYEVEMPLMPIITQMECNGVKISQAKLNDILDTISIDIASMQGEIKKIIGREITITKPADIEQAVYKDLKLHEKYGLTIKTTKTGKMSTSEKDLACMRKEPIVDYIMKLKKIHKLLSTYVLGMPEFINEKTGLIHAWFNQHITATGRLSSSDPNLQNIPQRSDQGKLIRGAFVSRWTDEGGLIFSADQSQAELRILAHMSQDPVLLEAYRNNLDVHQRVASIMFHKKYEDVDKKERNSVKTINYGLLYGMGVAKLAIELNVSMDEAESLKLTYLSTLKGVKNFIHDTIRFLNKHGYTETIFGRRRYLPTINSTINSERAEAISAGVNHTAQGSNADIIKRAMIKISPYLETKKSLMIMQVHDELVFDVHPTEIEIIKPDIIKLLESTVTLSVPMIAEGRYGRSWMDAH